MVTKNVKTFCSSSYLNFLYNYFDDSTKLFSDLYLAKFLDILVKPFFPCTIPGHYY